ncbi:MAG TPA: isoprenylcysteine carboxylmethyltransferase family protein [Nitrospirota bacterium]|nr:isoprenylcysteine carboxylmethyltransferase family protein [Nitrospirota bacterium]
MNRKTILGSAIVLYFIIGFEILIMISPFAGLFYSVFTPFLFQLSKHAATRWLVAFFLPHMVVPPDGFLKFIRIMGSILFITGIAVFLVCAFQVYASKFLKKGAVLGGLYSFIRHPQYVALGCAGLGLSILWPRIFTVVLWLVMIALYYLLSKDEERRMLKSHPETYRSYIEKTGMFLPGKLEKKLSPSSVVGKLGLFVLICAFTMGGVFFLRDYTIKHLPLWTNGDITSISITPEDEQRMEHRMNDILSIDEIRAKLKPGDKYLVYFIPTDYIMQGLIADTGTEWRLYTRRHFTIMRFMHWIFHPFSHLAGESGHFHEHAAGTLDMQNNIMVRRLIFLSVSDSTISSPYDFFSINTRRTPLFMADVDIHDVKLVQMKDLSQETGWGKLPTPAF